MTERGLPAAVTTWCTFWMLPSFRNRRAPVRGVLGWIVAIIVFGACGGTGPSGVHPGSPTPDQTQRYVALVHSYWVAYKKAEGDIPSFADECGYYSSKVQPSACRPRIVAILPVHEKFLADLNITPAPSQFAADDQAFRTQIPAAIAHLQATLAAAESGNAEQVSSEFEAYVAVMQGLFPNLDHVDPSIVHD